MEQEYFPISTLKILYFWARFPALLFPQKNEITDLVYLNLHEKAHGPYGLIAGTTGSGKSETIQSYILSLAVNFHP
ncbi:FtsK/SpoIIIE family protein, partial [Streptococcus sanguinis SK160]